MKNTPGQWWAAIASDARPHKIVAGEFPEIEKPRLIAEVINYDVAPEHANRQQDEANTYLIAAAPELKSLVEQFITMPVYERGLFVEKARALLAKAEGRTE